MTHTSIKAPHTTINVGERGKYIVANKPEAITLDIPLPDATIAKTKLFLVRNTTMVLTSDSTKPVTVDQPIVYRGVVEGLEENSLVSIIIASSGKKTSGFIMAGNRTYIIDELEKKDATTEDVKQNANIIFDITDNQSPVNYEGDTLEAPIPPITFQDPQQALARRLIERLITTAEARVGDSVKWYWEVESDIYTSKGSLQATSDFIQALFNQVQTIYANEGIAIELKTLYIWTTTDPYVGSSSGNKLSQFNSHRVSWDGDLAQLIGYSSGGVAYTNAITMCEYGLGQLNSQQGYSGIYSTYSAYPAYSWTINVLAHEMGHQLGSKHTNACVWNGNNTKIDDCAGVAGYEIYACPPAPDPLLPVGGGTIMSYCHLTSAGINMSKGFGTQPREKMLTNINASTCLTPPNSTLDVIPPTAYYTTPVSMSTVSGIIPLTVFATDNIGITKVDFYKGTILFATDTVAPYTASWDTTTVPNGATALIAKAYDSAGNVRVTTINFTVSNQTGPDTTAPVISITSPIASTLVTGTFPVTATATDNVGGSGVSRVDFYRGATLIGSDADAPYSISWNTSTGGIGSAVLTAVATDGAGNTTTSAGVTVTVTSALDTTFPTVSITAPTSSTFVAGTVPVTATASDNVGVTKVDFYKDSDTVPFSTKTTAPYTTTLTTTLLSNGSHKVKAIAYDAAGNSKTSTVVTFTVDNTLPTVALSAPATSATVTGTVAISATASDNTGIKKVDFYDGTTLLGSDTTAGYSYSWNTKAVANGAHTLTAVATDKAGNTKTSVARTVTVNNIVVSNTAPVVSAGSAQTITTLNTTLTGTATDDGLPNPPATLTKTWTKVSGPGTVTFTSPSATSTGVTFSSTGTYVLRLTASDGVLTTTSDVTVTSTQSGGGGSSFSDSFNRANGTVGNGWSVGSGGFTITNNKLAIVASSLVNRLIQPSIVSTNQTVTSTFTRGGSSSATKSCVLMRYQDASNYYAGCRIQGGSSYTHIEVVQNGVIVKTYPIKNTSGVNINTGNDTSPFTLTASASGSTLGLTLTKSGGTTYVLAPVTDTTFSTGSAGVLINPGAVTDTADDFSVI